MTDKTSYQKRLKLLARYRNGSVGYGVEHGNKFTVSYYDNRISPYFGELEEKGLVIDAETILHDKDFTSWVMKDPTVNPKLTGWQYKKFTYSVLGGHSIVHILYPEKESKEDICDLAKNPLHEIGALDEVSPVLMANIWQLRGAKIGVREGDEIHWLNSTQTRILDFASRFDDAF